MKKIFLTIFLLAFGFSVQAEPLKLLSIRDFKGLSTKTSSYDLAPEYATKAHNIRLTEIGSLKKRFSRSAYNDTSLGSNPITHLDRIYIGSNEYLIAGYTTFLKVGDDSAGTFSNLKTGLTTGLRFQGQTFKDFHYLGNGTDTNIRTDGTSGNTTSMGCQVPGSAPTMAEGAAGSLDAGKYYGKVTFVYDDYQESNGSASDDVTIAASKKIAWSAIPTGASGSGVTQRKLYRTKADTTTPYYLLTTIDDNTTTTYTDNTADADLSSDTIPTDHSVPPDFKYITLHKERLFMAGVTDYESLVYYTDIEGTTAYPDIVPSTNYVVVGEDDGDVITGLAEDPMGILTVFKRNHIYKIYTEGSPESWGVSASFSNRGCNAPYTITETPQGIIYLSRTANRKELRVFNGQESKLISERIEPTLAKIDDNYLDECVGVYYEGKYYLAYTDAPSGASYNNRVLIVDLLRDAFSIDIKDVNCFSVWDGSDDWGQLSTGDSQAGIVYREETYDVDLMHEFKSEIDEGTYSNCSSSGTEQDAYVTLTSADLSDSVGAQVANTLTTNAASTYSDADDTAWPSGSLTSEAYEINANSFISVLWGESLGSNGDITVEVRAGDTSAACKSASWSDKFTDPTSSDISDVTAGDYVQYRVRLYTNDVDTVTTPKLYKESDYIIWVNAGLGATLESSIPFLYQTGDLDCGSPFKVKRFRQVRTKADLNGDDYTIKYYLDGSDTLAGTFTISSDSNTEYFDEFGERIRFKIEEESENKFTFRELNLIYSEEPLY